MSNNSGTKQKQQAESRHNAAQPGAEAIRANRAKQNRQLILRQAIPAMLTLYKAGVPPENQFECMVLYTRACMERAWLTGDTDILLEKGFVERTADLFDMTCDQVDKVLLKAMKRASADHAACKAAALPKFEARELVVIGHRPLVDMKAVARAFEKTKKRGDALFGSKPIPGASRVNGKWPMTKRVRTGIPNWTPESNVVEHDFIIPDGPGTDRFTTAERKVMAAELGVKIATLREKELELDPAAFEAWADKRRKTMATRAKNEAEKKARAGRRKRDPNKTAAVRDFAERMGYSERHAWRLCEGLTTEEIRNRTPRQTLVEISPSPKVDAPVSVSRPVSRLLSRVSDSVSATDPENRALSHTFPSSPVVAMGAQTRAEEPAKIVTKRKAKRCPKLLHFYDREILASHYKETTGKTLSDVLVRKWKQRKKLKVKLKAAMEWISQPCDDPAHDPAHESETLPAAA